MFISAVPLLQAFCAALPLRSVSTTAAFSAIRCRCGMSFFAASFPQAFCEALPLRPVSTTAVFSAIRCRCGMAFSPRPCCRSSVRPYASVLFPQRQCFPRFSAVVELHSSRPLATGSLNCIVCQNPFRHSIFPTSFLHFTLNSSFTLFPPSEGVQNSRVFRSPSEGVWRRHSFESALYPCFSCHRAFPTFRRCAGFPCFRLTFRRCAVSK